MLEVFPRFFEKNIFNKCFAQDEYATNPKKIAGFEVSSRSTICGQVSSWCSKNRHTLLYMLAMKNFLCNAIPATSSFLWH